MSSPAEMSARPWYRHVWPWALMLPPALAVAGGIAMISLATGNPGALVVDDYARIEELTAERFERDRAAAALGLSAELVFDAEAGSVQLTLQAPADFAAPETLRLVLQHATRAEADGEFELLRQGGSYRGMYSVPAGRYLVELLDGTQSWRLAGGPSRLDRPLSLRPQASGD